MRANMIAVVGEIFAYILNRSHARVSIEVGPVVAGGLLDQRDVRVHDLHEQRQMFNSQSGIL